MFMRRCADRQYTPQQIVHWLTWLARQMVQRSQTVFYIEQLQPDWLLEKQRWASRLFFLLFGQVIGLAFGLVVWLLFWRPFFGQDFWLPPVLTFGLAFGLVVGRLLWPSEKIVCTETLYWSWANVLSIRLIFGLVGRLFVGGIFVGLFVGGGLAAPRSVHRIQSLLIYLVYQAGCFCRFYR